MINKDIKLPFYAKVSIFIIGLFTLFAILYIAQGIIIPLVFALIISIVLHPVVNFFVRIKINRIVAIIITLLLTFIVIAAFVALLFSQAVKFSESWPVIVDKFTVILNQSTTSIADYLGVNPQNISDWISKTKSELINNSASAIGQTIVSLGGGLVILFLIPTYVFIILFYEPLLIEFIHKISNKNNKNQVNEIVTQTKTVIQRYLIGLTIETVIVAVLNSAGLFILGIDYAIMIGIIGALLNLIPYIGGLVAVALPMIVALVTKESMWYPIYVLAIYYFIQIIDNNYIVPYVVSSKVKINALFSIIVVIVGNALWGISGMFLSIPLIAIVKLIFDHIEPLKPWGFLLGDTMPPLLKIKPVLLKIKPIFRKIKKKS